MPDLDVRITSMYPPGVQGRDQSLPSATIAGCLPSGESKSSREVRMGSLCLCPAGKHRMNTRISVFPDGGIPQRAETGGIGSLWRHCP